jgi:phosphoribosylanthranilate isomerase
MSGKGLLLRIKICGITSVADALLAADLGADAIGLNFYPPSPRYVDRTTATAIVRALPPFVEAVGLFVNLPLADVVTSIQHIERLHTIQWHGDRPELCPPCPFRFIPAFQVADSKGLAHVMTYLDACRQAGALPSAVLIDGQLSGQYGGTGRPAPWNLLAEFHPSVPLILAGGLTPQNVAEAICLVRPYAVDVASGVESTPGRKDPDKLRRFIDNAREATSRIRP